MLCRFCSFVMDPPFESYRFRAFSALCSGLAWTRCLQRVVAIARHEVSLCFHALGDSAKHHSSLELFEGSAAAMIFVANFDGRRKAQRRIMSPTVERHKALMKFLGDDGVWHQLVMIKCSTDDCRLHC